ncbi:calcium binding EGF domain protein, partial [Teladorsagia circumcincta]
MPTLPRNDDELSLATIIAIVNECAEARLNNCSPNAKCIDKAVGYTCRCVPGFVDTSPEGARQPGRICTQLVNECATKQHDCDANAICRDEPIGYRCQCPFGFADASKNPSKPGRLCVQ